MNIEFFSHIENVLASERLDAYRQDGAGEITTFSRYLLNMALCESLYSPLQFAEIALRNAIHVYFTDYYGKENWYDIIPDNKLRKWQPQQIADTKRKLSQSRKSITPGAIVAELNFGFWTSFFNKFHGQSGLGHRLAANVFPYAPKTERSLSKLDDKWERVRRLRNRVFHHERILHWKSLEQQHSELLELIKWISPELEEAAVALDRFTTIRSEWLEPWREKIRSHWPQSS